VHVLLLLLLQVSRTRKHLTVFYEDTLFIVSQEIKYAGYLSDIADNTVVIMITVVIITIIPKSTKHYVNLEQT